MYVKLPLSWLDHPFSLSQFIIKNRQQIKEIKECAILHIEVDFDKSELPPEPARTKPKEVEQPAKKEIEPPAQMESRNPGTREFGIGHRGQ